MTTVNYPTEFKGFAISDPSEWSHPKLTSYEPKAFGPNDVDIEVECCGVCASELFTLKNDWSKEEMKCKSSAYGPKTQCVGHEIIGKVVKVGPKCTEYKLGDRVGLGAQASCCAECARCTNDNEQYCPHTVSTYASRYPDGYVSQGGYASHVRANARNIFHIPSGLESPLVAPLMCGGLTVYSPIKRGIQDILDAGKETPRVAIIGIGGLGHMAIMIAKALGAKVTAFSRSSSKKEDAVKMGADEFVATAEDPEWSSRYFDAFHLVLNCATSTNMDLSSFLNSLKVNRSFITVGLPHIDEKLSFSPFSFFGSGSTIGSSALGSKKEINELLDLAVEHNFRPWVETLDINEENVSQALTRLDKGDVRYRFTLTGFHEFFGTGKN